MNILVLGGTGAMGVHLVELIERNGACSADFLEHKIQDEQQRLYARVA